MKSDADIQSLRDKTDQLNQLAWDVRVSDSPRAFILSQETVELSKSIDYKKGLAEGLRSLGFCYVRLSKNEEGLHCLNEAFHLFESLNDLKGLSVVYEYLGIIQRNWGNYSASLELLFKGLALSEQTAFLENVSTNCYQIGVTYKHLGNYEKALDYLYKCLPIARSINYILMEAYAINVIGSIYFENEDYARALEYYEQGLVIRQQSGDKWGEAGSLDNIGTTHLKLGAWQQAIDYCSQSLAISESTGDKRSQANALLHLAEIYKQTNDVDRATRLSNESLLIREASSDKKGEAEILLFLAELHKPKPGNKKKNTVLEWLLRALKISEDIKARDLVAKTHFALYEYHKLGNNYEEALRNLELCLTIEKELHKDAINQKVLTLEISHKAEEAKKEAEAIQHRNEELTMLNEEIEGQKRRLEETLADLKATQAQLIQSEKMASLGELTAGIAHEIQNPLNFVNNFSEVNTELVDELLEEMGNGNLEEVKEIANDIRENQQRITQHGKRADAIVKGMLQHSRSSSGIKEPTDMNELADEYLRLSYHGLRAKDKTFNATIQTDFNPGVPKINVIPQDIGRVLLNLYNNAFYAVAEKKKRLGDPFEPILMVSTSLIPSSEGGGIEIRVRDNGDGIPQKVVDKIFQPFFTTKPTGQGTGLGLSLSYDIIKAHGGELKVKTREGEGSEFIIQLPIA
jgi:two-component system, NtrC family, sensor kinase